MNAAIVEHDVTVLLGDVREQLATLPDVSVNCIVTSPPYYGLRDYGCEGQIGLEASPAEYVAQMVAVFSEARRVLADDGVLWLNLGSSYASSSVSGPQGKTGQRAGRTFTAQGAGFVAASAHRDAGMNGTPCTAPPDSTDLDCAYPDLCGECAAAQSSRISDSVRPAPADVSPLERRARDTERPGSTSASLDAAPRVARRSTSLRSSAPHREMCSHCGNCGVCLAVLGSSSRDARLCGRRAGYSGGTSQHGSASGNPGTDALGSAWLNYTAALGPKSLIPTPWMVAMSLQADGWILRNAVVWSKPNAMPESVTDRLSCRYEHVFLFSKSRRYWFDLDAVKQEPGKGRNPPATIPRKYAHMQGGKGSINQDGWTVGPVNPGDVWTIATSPFPGAHFATMPAELARRCILAGCPETGTVLDPFAGSGTTLMVARQLGRKSVGIELNPAYVDIIRDRIGQTPLDFGNAS